jgi:hypothetical protein
MVKGFFLAEWGIRTRGPFDKSTVFKTAAIDHSANSPAQKYKLCLNLQIMISIFFKIKGNDLKQRDKKFNFTRLMDLIFQIIT